MATLLDIGLLQAFDIIFPFILVFALVYALLQKTKVIGETIAVNAIIAGATAFLVLLSENALEIIKFIIPWFAVAVIFFVLLLLIFYVFGAKEADIFSAMKADKAIIWVILGVAIVIIMAGFGHVLGQSIGPYLDEQGNVTTIDDVKAGVATGSFQQNITATLFHPKVLGLFILFGVMIFAVALLTGE